MTRTVSHPLPPGAERRSFLEQQPTYWLKRCYQALRREVDQGLRAYGITLSQREVLLALWDGGPTDQGTLRVHLGLEQSSVSRLVDGLVRRGLVRVDEDARDRRVRVASLTPAGIDLLHQTPGSSQLGGRIMTEGLAPEEHAELVRLLRRCTENLMNRQRPEDGHGREETRP